MGWPMVGLMGEKTELCELARHWPLIRTGCDGFVMKFLSRSWLRKESLRKGNKLTLHNGVDQSANTVDGDVNDVFFSESKGAIGNDACPS